nr:tensin-3-like [Danio rerio]|eukprot:XP_021322200.1 tensin-3-like [Danio rerio]
MTLAELTKQVQMRITLHTHTHTHTHTHIHTHTHTHTHTCEECRSHFRENTGISALSIFTLEVREQTEHTTPLQAPASTLDRFSVRRNSSRSGALCRPQHTSSTSSPDHTLSASSDSGLSSVSLPTAAPASALGPGTAAPSRQERAELKRLLSGCGVEEWSRDRSSQEPAVAHTPPTPHILLNGRARQKERETDILDDEVSRHDLHSLDSLGTLSSSCHKSSQNSLLSDGFGSPARAEEAATAPPAHLYLNTGYSTMNSGYPTQTWVHQQQMVAALQYSYLPEEDAVEQRFHNHTQDTSRHPTVANSPPLVPERKQTDKKHDEEFSSLTLDIDNSIHQLNQLILDLDPTFLPVSSKPSSLERPADRNGNTQRQERSRATAADEDAAAVPLSHLILMDYFDDGDFDCVDDEDEDEDDDFGDYDFSDDYDFDGDDVKGDFDDEQDD